MLLKQSTSRNLSVFMTDSADHVTGKTGLTLTITASKDGGSFASITPTVTELATGWYSLALTTTHTNTLGDLALHITSTGADPTDLVRQVVVDLPGATVSSVTGAVGSVTGAVGSVTGNVGGNVTGSVGSVTARVTANTDQLAGQTVTAAAGVTFPTSVASPTNITAGTITTVTNLTNAATAGDFTATMKTSIGTAVAASAVASVTGNVGGNVTGSVGSIATGGIAAASFAAGAIDAAAIATDAIGALELAAGAASEIATAVRSELTTELGRIDAAVSTRATQTSVDTIDDFVDTEVAAIKAKTDQLVFTTANRVDCQVFGMQAGTVTASAIATDAIDADAIAADAVTEIQSGLSTLTAAGVRTAVGLASANLDTQLTAIDDAVDTEVAAIKTVTDKLDTALELDGAVYRFTVNALELAPTGGSAPTAADIADAVWEEAIGDHSGTTGSTAEALGAAGAAGDPWTTLLPGAYGAGSAGKIIGDNIDAAISTRLATAGYTAPLDAAGTRTAVGLASANLDTQLDALPTAAENSTAIWSAGTRVLTAGTNIVLAKGTGVTGFNDLSAAQVNAEADTALSDVGVTSTVTGRIDAAISTRASQTSVDTIDDFVDTEVAAIKTVTDKLDTAVELDGVVYRFTVNALEQGAAGGGATAADIADAVWDEAIADHQASGSTGESLNGAGSAGNPWISVLEGSYTAGDLMRICAAFAAGKTTVVKLGTKLHQVTFRDITDSSDMIDSTVNNSQRTEVTVTP